MTSDPDRAVEEASETESARLEERLDAVERALTGSDREVTDAGSEAVAAAEREALAERLESVEERIEELEAATQAVRGYAGAIRSVNREVERRADLALARATDARDAARSDGASQSSETSRAEGGSRPDDTIRSDDTTRSDNAIRPADSQANGRETIDPALPTDAAIEAAIPGDDPATERNHGSDASSRTDVKDHAGDGDDSAESRLERLRNAL